LVRRLSGRLFEGAHEMKGAQINRLGNLSKR
jgi:hypothetical protein